MHKKIKVADGTPSLVIIESQRAGKTRPEREEDYLDLVENANDLIQSVSPDGRFLYVNRAWRETLGYTQEEVGRLSMFDIIHPDSQAHCEEMFRRMISGERVDRVKAAFVTRDGRKIMVEGSANCKFVDGKPVATRGIFRNITEREEMEEALQQSRDNLRVYLENAPDGVYLNDLKGKFLYGNKRAEEITGYKKKELIGESFLKLGLLPTKYLARAGKLLVLNALGKSTGPDEFELTRKGGTSVCVEITTAPIKEDGKVVVLGFVRDITERKEMEQQLQERNEQLDAQNEELQSQTEELMAQQQELVEKTGEVERANRLKSEFLANMSHELRTPLNVIIGFSQLMVDEIPGRINEEQRQCLNDISDSSQHLLDLVNGVLDISKIESGKVELKLEDIALTEVVASFGRAVMPILTPRKQSLEIEIEEGLPPVRAEEGKLGQVLLNLVDNASKATPDGGKLKIEVAREGDWCQVSVVDNGIGITEEDRERIFEPFCQLDNPLASQKGGTGLGLPLVKRIIERYGGRIWVESEYGQGSRFTFTLPLVVNKIQSEGGNRQ